MSHRTVGDAAVAGRGPGRVLCQWSAAVLLLFLSVLWVQPSSSATGGEPRPQVERAGPTVVATPSPSPGTDELERRKLEQEIRQLELENDRTSGPMGWFLAVGPFVTVVVGVLTLGATLWKQSHDLAAARRNSDEQASQWRAEFLRIQELDRANRVTEHLRRFDERISAVAGDLGSDSPTLRLNGAAALGLFVKARNHDLHCDLLNIVVANLKAGPEHAVSDLLRGHLTKLLRLLFDPGRALDPDLGDRLDLTGVDLYRLDLHGLDLRGTVVLDVAFSDLTHANLRETRLFRARGGEAVLDHAHFSRARMDEARFNKAKVTKAPAYFHETSLVSATFDDAVLPGSDFRRARLQGAKFRRADLRGAHFEEANLADAYFQGAVFDEATLRSIARGARNWRKAWFDPAVLASLVALSETP